jgi:hypothetical protein
LQRDLIYVTTRWTEGEGEGEMEIEVEEAVVWLKTGREAIEEEIRQDNESPRFCEESGG